MTNTAPAQPQAARPPNQQSGLSQAAAGPAPQVSKPPTVVDFVLTAIGPDGFETTVSVRNVAWESPDGVAVRAKALEAALKKAGFKAMEHPGPSITVNAGGGTGGAAAKPAATYTGEVYTECPECGGQIFDNREKKQTGQMKANAPWFSCRDADGCGWKKWPDRGARRGGRGG